MRGFTKIALIVSLILAILGSMFCMIGLGIGFSFSEFWEEVEDGEYAVGPLGSLPSVFQRNRLNWKDDGESWNSVDTQQHAFSLERDGIQNLDLDVYYGTLYIQENMKDTEVRVTVEYRKKNHRRNVETYMDGGTLKIKETGSKYSFQNDSTRITVMIPSEMKEESQMFRKISLKQGAGDIIVNMPLTAEEININVDAGECEAVQTLTALDKFKADVGAGEIELEEVKTREINLIANVGQITADRIAADLIDIDCGIGSVEAEAAGIEQDYNYEVQCGVGDVTIGDNSFSGLSNKRKIENHTDVGEVEISFTESL